MEDETNPSQLEDTNANQQTETKMSQKGSTEDNATDDVGLYHVDSACTMMTTEASQRDDEVEYEDVNKHVAPASSVLRQLSYENFVEIQRQKKRETHKKSELEREILMKNLQNAMEAEETLRNTRISIMNEAYDETLMHEYLSSEESDSDQSDYYRQSDRCTVSFKADFIRNFDDLPNISDISSEREPPRLTNISSKSFVEIDPNLDIGRFVDPLTGEPIPSTSSSTETEVSTEEEIQKEEEQTSSEIELMPVIQYKQFENKTDTELDDFLQISAKESDVLEVDLPTEQEVAQVRKIIADLIHDYVDEIVQRSEYIDPDIALRKHLNKKKLILALKELVDQYKLAKSTNQFLNQKINEYCRRMKTYRLISPLSSELKELSRPRYYTALLQLDHARELAKTAKRIHNRLMARVTMDLKYVQNISMYTEKALEETLQHYLVRKDSQHLPYVVKRLISDMARMRNEISDARLKLITIKNTEAQLNDRIQKYEHLGDDLTLSQFIAIQNDVATMDKKLEERNAEMARSLRLYNEDLSNISHMRDKCHVVESALLAAQLDLKLKSRTETQLREKIYKLKLKHMDLLKQHKLLCNRGGLLYLPRLMQDYDVEHDKVVKKRRAVAQLRAEIRFIKNQYKFTMGSKASRKSSDSSFEFRA